MSYVPALRIWWVVHSLTLLNLDWHDHTLKRNAFQISQAKDKDYWFIVDMELFQTRKLSPTKQDKYVFTVFKLFITHVLPDISRRSSTLTSQPLDYPLIWNMWETNPGEMKGQARTRGPWARNCDFDYLVNFFNYFIYLEFNVLKKIVVGQLPNTGHWHGKI